MWKNNVQPRKECVPMIFVIWLDFAFEKKNESANISWYKWSQKKEWKSNFCEKFDNSTYGGRKNF